MVRRHGGNGKKAVVEGFSKNMILELRLKGFMSTVSWLREEIMSNGRKGVGHKCVEVGFVL